MHQSQTKALAALIEMQAIDGLDETIRFLLQELSRSQLMKERRVPAPAPALAIAIEALEFYADKDNWSGRNSEATRDKGARALTALGEITDSEDE